MTNANWGLLDPNAFGRGFEQTSGIVGGLVNSFREGERKNALSQYATNPNDPASLNALAQVDPALAMQARQQQQQQALLADKAQRETAEDHRENIVRGAQIVRQINPKDQASWTQALATAQRMGIDVSQVPQQFDPQYVQGLIATADAFEPQKPEASPYQVVAGQPGAGVYRFDKREGTMTELVRANDGSGVAGTPVNRATGTTGGGPRPGTIEDGYRFKGGDPARQENWEPVAQGGPTQPASATFRP